MTATASAERAPRHGAAEPSRLCLFLGASLLLHGALLWLNVGQQRAQLAGATPRPALTLTLKRPAADAAASTPAPSPAALAPLALQGDALRAKPLARALTAAPAASPSPAASEPEPEAAAVMAERRLDVDQLRAQARELARAPALPLVSGGERQPAAPAAIPDLLDRPLLDALSRRIGKPLRVASEQRLADGSRMIRFVGNVCLHVPQHLSLGGASVLTPTMLLPTNCND